MIALAFVFAFLVVILKGSAVVLALFASPFLDQSDLQPNALAAEGHAFTRAVKGGEPKEGPPSGVPKQAGPEALPPKAGAKPKGRSD
jgi:hypothetical protein